MISSGEIHLSLANDLAEIARLAELVDRTLAVFGISEERAAQLNLALDELLTNTISYGYEDNWKHVLDVRLSVHDGVIETVIEDDAIAFDPFDRPPADTSRSLDERPIGGLGIHLIRTMTDEAHYLRLGNRNQVVLRVTAQLGEQLSRPPY